MLMTCGHEIKEIPRDDPRFAVAIVLRNFLQLLVDQGILEPEQVTELGLMSLRQCSDVYESGDPDIAAIDFVWSVFPKGPGFERS